jgi:ribosome-binding protein aMBF1 (putative translation factor)
LISKNRFIAAWPNIRRAWAKIESRSQFRDWWQTIYEQLAKKASPEGKPPTLFKNIGAAVKVAREKKGLSQKDLAQLTGINQPDISKIEKGRENITLRTLFCLTKVLGIKKITLAG